MFDTKKLMCEGPTSSEWMCLAVAGFIALGWRSPLALGLDVPLLFGSCIGIGLYCCDALRPEIAAALEVNWHTPALWRKRFGTQGLEGLWEVGPGRGRKSTYCEQKVAAILDGVSPKGQPERHQSTLAAIQSQAASHALFQALAGRQISGKADRPTWWAFTSIPRKRVWWYAWMRRAKFRPWIPPSHACRSRKAAAAPSLMTMSGMELRRYLRPGRSWKTKSLANVFPG